MQKEIIRTDLAPAAIGPYSQVTDIIEINVRKSQNHCEICVYNPQAVKAGGMLYVSGCIGLIPAEKKMVDGGVGPQARQVLENLKNIVEAGGSSLSSVVKCTVLLSDMSHFAEVNAIYAGTIFAVHLFNIAY